MWSILDPDGTPEAVWFEGARDVELDDYPKRKTDYFEARGELIKSSLITRNIDTEEVRIHRLVQDVVRQKMSLEEILSVFNSTVVLLSAVWPFVKLDNRNLVTRCKIGKKYYPHMARLKQLIEKPIEAGEIKPSLQTAALFNKAAW